VKNIIFPGDVVLPTTYLNDVRFDLRQGKAGVAYITDSGSAGIIVVDLDSGESWRKLSGHSSTKPDPGFIPIVEGERSPSSALPVDDWIDLEVVDLVTGVRT